MRSRRPIGSLAHDASPLLDNAAMTVSPGCAGSSRSTTSWLPSAWGTGMQAPGVDLVATARLRGGSLLEVLAISVHSVWLRLGGCRCCHTRNRRLTTM